MDKHERVWLALKRVGENITPETLKELSDAVDALVRIEKPRKRLWWRLWG